MNRFVKYDLKKILEHKLYRLYMFGHNSGSEYVSNIYDKPIGRTIYPPNYWSDLRTKEIKETIEQIMELIDNANI